MCVLMISIECNVVISIIVHNLELYQYSSTATCKFEEMFLLIEN